MSNTSIKISVVVPVYNVEKYLKKCIESLVNQTYKNIEIILVDDGSTDSSGEKCDFCGRMYSNVFALHKSNGGLSSARNYAIPYVQGEYVAFVDSDDYVDIDYIECMVNAILHTKCDERIDMVICSHINELEGKSSLHNIPAEVCRDLSYQRLSAQAALEIMCYEREFGTSACGKLIAAKLIRQFNFPEGRLYEDLATIFKMIGASESIMFVRLPMYHYVQREGSIRNSLWNHKVMDLLWASQNLMDYIDRRCPDIHAAGVYRFFFSANEFYIRAFNEKDYMSIISPIRTRLQALYPEIKKNKAASIKQKVRFGMLVRAPRLYRCVWRFYKSVSSILH